MPVDFEALPLNSYLDAPKFRAVLSQYFDPAERIKAEREDYVDRGGMREDAEFMFPDSPTVDENEMVSDAVEWTFRTTRMIDPGRFNDSSFPALYTAKEAQTAAKELEHWSAPGLEYVIFNLHFSGTAADLRPMIDKGELPWPNSHAECQPIALTIRTKADGLACYSARRPGGSCCAIFKDICVAPGSVIQRGFL